LIGFAMACSVQSVAPAAWMRAASQAVFRGRWARASAKPPSIGWEQCALTLLFLKHITLRALGDFKIN